MLFLQVIFKTVPVCSKFSRVNEWSQKEYFSVNLSYFLCTVFLSTRMSCNHSWKCVLFSVLTRIKLCVLKTRLENNFSVFHPMVHEYMYITGSFHQQQRIFISNMTFELLLLFSGRLKSQHSSLFLNEISVQIMEKLWR